MTCASVGSVPPRKPAASRPARLTTTTGVVGESVITRSLAKRVTGFGPVGENDTASDRERPGGTEAGNGGEPTNANDEAWLPTTATSVIFTVRLPLLLSVTALAGRARPPTVLNTKRLASPSTSSGDVSERPPPGGVATASMST